MWLWNDSRRAFEPETERSPFWMKRMLSVSFWLVVSILIRLFLFGRICVCVTLSCWFSWLGDNSLFFYEDSEKLLFSFMLSLRSNYCLFFEVICSVFLCFFFASSLLFRLPFCWKRIGLEHVNNGLKVSFVIFFIVEVVSFMLVNFNLLL